MKVEAKVSKNSLKTEVKVREFTYTLDQKLEDCGENLGANPVQVLATSLAACKVMFAKSYADKKGMKLDDCSATVEFNPDELKENGRLNFKVDLKVSGELNMEEKNKLEAAVAKCAVAKILSSENIIEQNIKFE